MDNTILIINFGTKHLNKITDILTCIDRHILIKIVEWDEFNLDNFVQGSIIGIILSGSPYHLYESGCPTINPLILKQKIPVLGICYGMQFIANMYGGIVNKMDKEEFGIYQVDLLHNSKIFDNLTSPLTVCMQHYDQVLDIPNDIKILGHTKSCIAAIENVDESTHTFIYGVQFHPEIDNTGSGKIILSNFMKICKQCLDSKHKL